MRRPMEGIRVLEVAQFTFAPAAGAVLADWGADVIKVEHAGHRRRPARAHDRRRRCAASGSFQPLMEHPNRGKRSIGLALEMPSARDGAAASSSATADVFLTNFLPRARRRSCASSVDDIRAVNPSIIYVRGSGHGQRGPEAERGGYDGSTFWSRMGSAWGDHTRRLRAASSGMPAGAYGDSIGGMTIAGGIAAALFARERTGEPSVVDVSLLGVGAWAIALSLGTMALLAGGAAAAPHAAAAPRRSTRSSATTGRRTTGGSCSRCCSRAATSPTSAGTSACERPDRRRAVRRRRGAHGQRRRGRPRASPRSIAARTLRRVDRAARRRWRVRGRRSRTRSRSWPTRSCEANGCIARRSSTPTASTREARRQPGAVRRDAADDHPGPQFAEHTDEILARARQVRRGAHRAQDRPAP